MLGWECDREVVERGLAAAVRTQNGAVSGEGPGIPEEEGEQEAMQEVLCDQGGDRQHFCWLPTHGWWVPPGDSLLES